GHAQCGKPPGILHVRIERKTIRGDGQRSGMAKNLHRAGEILLQRLLEFFSPARRAWRQSTHGKTHGGEIEACIESATAVKTQLLRIQFVEVMKDAADRVAF